MNDMPPDVDRLRTLETWLAHTLGRVQQRIGELEQQASPPIVVAREAPAWLAEYERASSAGRTPPRHSRLTRAPRCECPPAG